MKISSIIITESRSYLYEGLNNKHKNTMFLWESAGAKLIEANLTVDQINQIFANVEQGATAAGANESVNLTHNQINLIFEHVSDSIILEGITDFVKGAAGKAMNWAQTKGRNLTTTITADKLMQAWKKAGSPTDSEQLKQVMVQVGVPENVINTAYSKMNISASVPQATTATQTPATAPTSQAPAAVAKTKPVSKAPAQKPSAPNAMAQMTQQLTQPTQSSTGGTISTTQTGIRHTANPNNPNAVQPAKTGLVHKANPNNPNFKYANKTLH